MSKIRELKPGDHETYRGLWLYGITEHSAFFRIAPEDDLPTGIPTRFLPDSFTLGAFFGADLVGIVSLERDTPTKARHKALVSRMFVHPGAAGQGVGKALLERLITLAEDLENLRYVHLTVLASNARAVHLYSSLQFREYARELGGVLIGDRYVDELQMARQLVGT